MCCSATSSIQPRGRIYLIKDMLENGPAGRRAQRRQPHRPLPVLPGLHDDLPVGRELHAPGRPRARRISRRPTGGRCRTGCCAGCWRWCCRARRCSALALIAAALGKRPSRAPARSGCARCSRWRRARRPRPRRVDRPQIFPARGPARLRVALLAGCAQPALAPQINEATIRLLTRLGCEVVVAPGIGCCGALTHHLGRERRRTASPRPTSPPGCGAWTATGSTRSSSTPRAAARWSRITASCCAPIPTTRTRPRAVSRAGQRHHRAGRRSSASTLRRSSPTGQRVAYHSPARCSTASRSRREPKALLAAAGFDVRRRAGGPSLLRLGRHLQHAAAGDRRRAARPQGREHRALAPDDDRRRQYRLHHPDRPGTASRSCTRSSCSTGRPAARSRGMSPSLPDPHARPRWGGAACRTGTERG